MHDASRDQWVFDTNKIIEFQAWDGMSVITFAENHPDGTNIMWSWNGSVFDAGLAYQWQPPQGFLATGSSPSRACCRPPFVSNFETVPRENCGQPTPTGLRAI